MFAGAGLKPATVNRSITPYDVAPTLAGYLGIKPPSAAIGNPLPEIVAD
jgi:arylsulfatase A-like enzyme